MWSEELKKITRDVVLEFRFVPRGDVVHFKNSDGSTGFISVADIFAGKLLLKNGKNTANHFYGSIDELLDDGWVVD